MAPRTLLVSARIFYGFAPVAAVGLSDVSAVREPGGPLDRNRPNPEFGYPNRTVRSAPFTGPPKRSIVRT